MTPQLCPICGEPMDYQGVDDGGGDYGDSVCDTWVCDDCDYSIEADCLDYLPDDDDMTEVLPSSYAPNDDDIPF